MNFYTYKDCVNENARSLGFVSLLYFGLRLILENYLPWMQLEGAVFFSTKIILIFYLMFLFVSPFMRELIYGTVSKDRF
jgi:hypothetical protein